MTASPSVFVTGGGRRYHAAHDCRALSSGQLIWDCDDWVPGWPEPRAIRELPLVEAVYYREPCRVCKPGLPEGWPPDDFGHGPWPLGPIEICTRCDVPWPCATAVVLGATEGGDQ